MNWCVTRNMSWEAVEYLTKRYQISFENLPVSGDIIAFNKLEAEFLRRNTAFMC